LAGLELSGLGPGQPAGVEGDDLLIAPLLGGHERATDGSHPGVVGGNDQVLLVHLEGLAHRGDGALVGRHPADEGHPLADLLAFSDRSPVVAHDRVAEALEHLRGAVAFLLRVDHVGFGEH